MAGSDRGDLGRVFNEMPELHGRVRPTCPDELFADLVAITGMGGRSSVLEVGCRTGQVRDSPTALRGAVPGPALRRTRERWPVAGLLFLGVHDPG